MKVNMGSKHYVEQHLYHITKQIVDEETKKKRMQDAKPRIPFSKEIYTQGEAWFRSGLSLDEAPEQVRENTNFINGFNRAKRVANAAETLYNRGVEYFDNGLSLEEVNQKYGKFPMIIKGYEDAMMNCGKSKG